MNSAQLSGSIIDAFAQRALGVTHQSPVEACCCFPIVINHGMPVASDKARAIGHLVTLALVPASMWRRSTWTSIVLIIAQNNKNRFRWLKRKTSMIAASVYKDTLMKRGFTLIELLTVIAIILTLAAIIFPVIGRAKIAAYQAVDISNNKQIGEALTLYAADNNDLYPLAYAGDYGVHLYETPAIDPTIFPDSSEYTNSAAPYIKSLAVWRSAGVTRTWDPLGTKPPFQISFFMNSYMNSWPTTAIESSSDAILVWPAQGSVTTRGVGFAMPLIYTLSNIWLAPGQFPGDNYIFQNNGPDCVKYYGYFSTGDFRLYNNGLVLGYVDGHAKWSAIGSPGSPVSSLGLDGDLTGYPTNPIDAQNQCYYDWALSPHYSR